MNVLITRPDQRGQELVELLVEQGIFAIHQPLYRFEAGRDLVQLPSVLSQLNAGDYIFAVSQNALNFACDTLAQVGFVWRADLRYFAVGRSSAAHFSAQAEQAVYYPLGEETSEGLLEMPQMQAVQGKNIVVLRAESGRDYFPEQVALRGANVQCLECYQRIPISENIAEQISLCKRAGIDTIVATSADILQSLVEYTQESEQQWLKSCRLLVVSRRIATLARKLGWAQEHIQIAAKADNQTLFTALMTQFS